MATALSPFTEYRAKYPELFLPDPAIDPRSRTRTVPMQVLNLSFPRTGTMSMHAALNILGIPCYHSILFFHNVRDCAVWDAALDAKFFPDAPGSGPRFTRTQWDQLLGAYGAVSADPPAIAFAEDLVAAYPEAKVILIERDIERWHASFAAGVVAAYWSRVNHFAADVDPWWLGPIRNTHRRWVRGWFGAESRAEMEAKARDMYREHYAMVRRVTPKERLLEFRLEDGWEPLCKFLGKEVPACAFPKVNDQHALDEMVKVASMLAVWSFVKRLVRYAVPSLVLVGLAIITNRRGET